MIEVKVKETRVVSLCMDKSNYLNDVGNTEEKNSTVLHFLFPDFLLGIDINEYSKEVVFKNGDNVTHITIGNDLFVRLGIEQTIHPLLTFQVVCKTDEITWKTFPKTITLSESIADSGKSPIDELKRQWTAEAQRPLTILVNRVTEKVTELLNERRNKP